MREREMAGRETLQLLAHLSNASIRQGWARLGKAQVVNQGSTLEIAGG